MAKTYSTPTVATLGAADVITRGVDQTSAFKETPLGNPLLTRTTHHMIDL
jgi:hypothetical protein